MLASLPWLWMPITVGAALAQTLRNAAQRHLTAELGTLGATLVRFLYGLPFALLWLLAVSSEAEARVPAVSLGFFAWVTLGATTQILATALLLRTMEDRSFALGVAYSKTEVVQVAIIGFVLLGDPVSLPVAMAVIVAIAANSNKTPMFTLEKRVELARRVLQDLANVEVHGYAGPPLAAPKLPDVPMRPR